MLAAISPFRFKWLRACVLSTRICFKCTPLFNQTTHLRGNKNNHITCPRAREMNERSLEQRENRSNSIVRTVVAKKKWTNYNCNVSRTHRAFSPVIFGKTQDNEKGVQEEEVNSVCSHPYRNLYLTQCSAQDCSPCVHDGEQQQYQ